NEKSFKKSHLRGALILATAHLPVYRTYLEGGVSAQDRKVLLQAQGKLKEIKSPQARLAGRLLRWIASGKGSSSKRQWIMEWQKLTGPVMAKGLEDTAHYRYLPLSSLNEVGCKPVAPKNPVQQFHEFQRKRSGFSLNTTS